MVHPTAGTIATTVSTITLAAIGSTELFDLLPKSAIITIALGALALAGAYLKKDWQKATGAESRLAARMDLMEGRIMAQHQRTDNRLTVIETKLGMHDHVDRAGGE